MKQWTGRADLDRPWRSLMAWLIDRKVLRKETWNFDIILIEVFNSCNQNLGMLSMIVWKICLVFTIVTISAIFSIFLIINFDWKGNFKFWLFRQNDLVQIYQNKSESIWIQNIFILPIDINFGVKNTRIIWAVFVRITSKIQWVCKFRWLHPINHKQICQTISIFIHKKIKR